VAQGLRPFHLPLGILLEAMRPILKIRRGVHRVGVPEDRETALTWKPSSGPLSSKTASAAERSPSAWAPDSPGGPRAY
jgi:hypothetical protein